MLSAWWLYFTLGTAITVTLGVYWYLRNKRDKRRIKAFTVAMIPPPIEARVRSIRPRHGVVSENEKGFYHVSFVDTADTYFLISAPEIVQRCTRHQQPIPFCVAADPLVNADIPLVTGDALLEVID